MLRIFATLCLLVSAAAGPCLLADGKVTSEGVESWKGGILAPNCQAGKQCKKASGTFADGSREFQQKCSTAFEDECTNFNFPSGGCCKLPGNLLHGNLTSSRIICGDSFATKPNVSDFAGCDTTCVLKNVTEIKEEEKDSLNEKKCFDVGVLSRGKLQKCYTNVVWAKKTGIKDKTGNEAAFYKKYEALGLTENSSDSDFQCVLWKKTKNNITGDGHDCVEPCTGNAKLGCAGTAPTKPASQAGDSKTPAPKTAKSSGMPVYAWVLIILGVCCGLPCLGLLCSAFICYEAVSFILDPICGGKKKGAEKKKRAVKKPTEAAPALAATPMPVYTTSVPMPVYHQAPTVSYAAPHIVQAQPVYAGSVSYAAPAVAYAAPASVSYADPGLVPYTGDVTVHHVDGHHSQHLMNVHQPHQAVITHHVDGHTSSLAMQ